MERRPFTHRSATSNLVPLYVERGDTANADRHFSAAYELGREDGERFLAGAREEERKKNNAGAVAMYGKAIEKNPAYIDAYFGLAELYAARPDPDDAIATLEEVKKGAPRQRKGARVPGAPLFRQALRRNRKYILTQAITQLRARPRDQIRPIPKRSTASPRSTSTWATATGPMNCAKRHRAGKERESEKVSV